jgi:hypothetical protein
MKYEAPELKSIIPAIHVIHNIVASKSSRYHVVETAHPGQTNEPNLGYADWE